MTVTRWPGERISLPAVTAWISSQMPGNPGVIGSPTVLAPKEDDSSPTGVAAVFRVEDHEESLDLPPSPWMKQRIQSSKPIFFKAVFPAALHNSPTIYRFLAHYAPANSPCLLSADFCDNQVWMLFQHLNMQTVNTGNSWTDFLKIASTLARIQVALSDASPHELTQLPRITPERIVAQYDDFIRFVGEVGIHEGVNQLNGYRGRFRKLVRELDHGNWPMTINHIDLHPSNALMTLDGNVILCDWDGANFACPFLGLEILFNQACVFPPNEPYQLEGGLIGGKKMMRLFSLYIGSLPWHTREERERALNLGMCIAPIKLVAELLYTERMSRTVGARPMLIDILRVLRTRWELMDKSGRVIAPLPVFDA